MEIGIYVDDEAKERGESEQTIYREGQKHSYIAEKVIGHGSFGVVYKAYESYTREAVAIKKVFFDERYKNRECEIMKELEHPNIIEYKKSFVIDGGTKEDVYLNIVMEYFPEDLKRVMDYYRNQGEKVPLFMTKVFMYQILRALAYLHGKGICHRDIKPSNLLIDPTRNIIKLCDFGSAKKIVPGEENISYITSRHYRAPELILGARYYSHEIDIWSAGVLLVELINGEAPFKGENGVDQLIEIIRVLGTPNRLQLIKMNPDFIEFKFPQVLPISWSYFFEKKVPEDALDLISNLLMYIPSHRMKPIEALMHPFFDELRASTLYSDPLNRVPNLFDFFKEEIELSSVQIIEQLVPTWYRNEELERMQKNKKAICTPSRDYEDELDKMVRDHKKKSKRSKAQTTRRRGSQYELDDQEVYARFYDTKT
ncbi:unnamed protein product [Moneuplotes crassus]|uniref:Protein kinase domain-containing protein n=2 Tax=Euplotes crassus TaxID=5936 RepID=A0AAD1UID0_EUPCR|nr:unnamed protein product [Moneuplotes crassus]